MKVIFGCDPNAAELKTTLMKTAADAGWETVDFGSTDPIYANTAIRVAEAVAAGEAERGVLLCGTGIGMCIAANKVKGAYAALLTSIPRSVRYSATMPTLPVSALSRSVKSCRSNY